MEFYSVDKKPFRSAFHLFLSLMFVATGVTTVLFFTGHSYLEHLHPGERITDIIFYAMIAVAIAYSVYHQKRLRRIYLLTQFSAQVQAYARLYRLRLFFQLFSCLISCALCLVTERNAFLIYAILDLLFTLPYYPNQFLFRRELRNGEINLY